MLKCLKKTLPLLCAIFIGCISSQAFAHVKWFAPYDILLAPRDILTVLTPAFALITLGSVCCVFFLSLLDTSRAGLYMDNRINHYRDILLARLPMNVCARVIRHSLLIFFTSIWALGGIILTPELKYENSILVGAIQLMIIISLFSERSAKYAGIGILLLWAYSAYHYGFFHVSDYTIFIGLAVFLILSSYQKPQLTTLGFTLLYIAISITLQWASIEKFVYPEWSFPLLTERPYLTMGFGNENFMIMAGFVEFVFAFLLVAAGGISFLITTLGLALIFILAIFDFGKIDAIGHLAIIASLLVMALYGPTSINTGFSRIHKNRWVKATLISVIYCASLALFFALYYGIRSTWLMTSASH